MTVGQSYVSAMLRRVGTTAKIGEIQVPAIVRRPGRDMLLGQATKVNAKTIEVDIETDSLPGLKTGAMIIIGSGAVIVEGGVIPTTVYVAVGQPIKIARGTMTRVRCALA